MNIFAGKPYDAFLLVGRFQHIHIGHESLINTAFAFCDRGLILVGSAQESGTERNPFDVSTRIKMIKEIYGDALEVRPIEDMSNENDVRPEWGDFVLDRVDRYISKKPDVMIYGNDDARSRWFSPEAIKDSLEIIVPRNKIPVSATMLRQFMVDNDKKAWMQFVNPKLHKHFDTLRGELLSADGYKR